MFVRKQTILHASSNQTKFSRAAALENQDFYTLWKTFIYIWAILYLVVPHNL